MLLIIFAMLVSLLTSDERWWARPVAFVIYAALIVVMLYEDWGREEQFRRKNYTPL